MSILTLFNVHNEISALHVAASGSIPGKSVAKGATPVNYTSATDRQMTVRRDNVISITLRQV